MKKIFTLLLVALMGFGSFMAYADSSSKEQKQWTKNAEKMAKETAKDLKKEKWLFNGTSSLEHALMNYYLATEPKCGGTKKAKSVQVDGMKSMSLAEKKILMNAQTEYIQEVKAAFQGSIVDHSSQTDDEALEAYIADIEGRISGELKGDVRREFSVYRQEKNGTYTVRGFIIIDVNSSARKLDKYADQFDKDENIADAIRKAARGEK